MTAQAVLELLSAILLILLYDLLIGAMPVEFANAKELTSEDSSSWDSGQCGAGQRHKNRYQDDRSGIEISVPSLWYHKLSSKIWVAVSW